MKNPFEELTVFQTTPFVWHITPKSCPNTLVNLTEEQARYAAHAINKHDDVVSAIQRVIDDGWLDDEAGATTDGSSPTRDLLAALLAEEDNT